MPDRSVPPHFEILQRCGKGGMGVVFKARDLRLNRIVALKFLGPEQAESDQARTRFRREAEAIAALNHPNIATLYEVGEWEGDPYLVLEFLSGGTLKESMQAGSLALDICLRYASQLGAGLAFAHQQGVLHRDIKPANAMFSALGDLKLVDFGLAKRDSLPDLTQPGAAVGTGAYMAPEILRGQEASIQSDIYSLGVVIYEMLAGRPLFSASNVDSLYRRILDSAPPRLSSVRSDVPSEVCAAVKRALAKNPRDRWRSVRDLLNALGIPQSAQISTGEFDRTQTVASTPTVHPPTANRWWILAIAGIVLVLGGLYVIPSSPVHRWITPIVHPVGREELLVVLPFENLTGDPHNQALCDGLQETITNLSASLQSKGSKLLVPPSSEVRRSGAKSIAEARKTFAADLVVLGSVRKNGDGLALTLTLADARSGAQKDSRSIRMPAAGEAQLQTKLKEELPSLLGVVHPGAELASGSGPVTSNSQAYRLFLEGQGALQSRNLEQAIDRLSQAVKIDPTYTLARAKLAEAYIRQANATNDPKYLAMADAEASEASRTGTTPELLIVEAMIRKATGDADAAVRILTGLLKQDPANVEARRSLASALASQGRIADAEETYQEAIRNQPGYWGTYNDLALVYMGAHEYPRAERTLLTALSVAPENALLRSNLGALYFMQGRWDEASDQFQKTLAIKPQPLAFANLGTIQFYLGKYTAAASSFDQAAKLQPGNVFNWVGPADSLWEISSKRGQALEAYRKAADLASDQLGLNPKDARLRGNYALCLARLGQAPEALKQLQQTIEEAEKSDSTHYKAARVYAMLHENDKALAALKRYLTLGGDSKTMQREPDFEELRKTPAYRGLAEKRADQSKEVKQE
jgi:serine/threonine-protein kinase